MGLFSNQYDEDEGPYRVPSGSSQKPDFDVMTNYVQIPEEDRRHGDERRCAELFLNMSNMRVNQVRAFRFCFLLCASVNFR